MKNLRKGFTLVEMLIVVVIIGILAAALLPKLTGAQAATRDVARQKDLGDISAAIEMYSAQVGSFPTTTDNKASSLSGELVEKRAYIKEIPADPKKDSKIAPAGVGTPLADNSYWYSLLYKGGIGSGAYALVSRAETVDKANATAKMVEKMTNEENAAVEKIKLCDTVVIDKASGATETEILNSNGKCTVTDASQLRYVLIR